MEQQSRRGTELRKEREALGLSQEDVFRKLRIPLDFIRNIETGQLGDMVADTYATGFVRTYCTFLGKNPELYLAEMRPVRKPSRGLIDQAIHGDPSERPAWMTEVMMWAAIIAIIVLGWATYAIVMPSKTVDGPGRVQADSVDLRVPQFPMR